MIKSLSLRKNFRRAGTIIAVAGIVFVIFRIKYYWGDVTVSAITPVEWWFIGGLSILCGASNIILAVSWVNILEYFGVKKRRSSLAIIYGKTQLAKYVPGNIFQYLGRQAFGMAEGVPSAVLIKSMAWELVSLVVAGSLFICLALPALFINITAEISGLLFVGATLTVGVICTRLLGYRALVSILLHMVYLSISAVCFVFILYLVTSNVDDITGRWLVFVGCSVVAWLVGLVIPGAPAGIGIRESLLIMLLGRFVSESDLLAAVLLGRLITVVGDCILFFISASAEKCMEMVRGG